MMRGDEEELGTIVYDNAVNGQPLYHYAESDADGYIDPSEYEQPLPPRALQQIEPSEDRSVPTVTDSVPQPAEYPAPPRRFSAIPPSWGSDPVKKDPPEPPSIETIPNRRRGHSSLIGLFGLVGAIGLVGVLPGDPSTAGTAASTGPGGCLVGTVTWSASRTVPAGYVVADGSEVVEADHPELFAAVGPALPNLLDRYARGGLDAGATMDASVDASSVSVVLDDPGHAHIDAAGSTVLRDGRYALAHLYSFNADGVNLKDAGPAVVPAQTGISARLQGGTETRPASVVLVPLICAGSAGDP